LMFLYWVEQNEYPGCVIRLSMEKLPLKKA
jgi:hypothetical protein